MTVMTTRISINVNPRWCTLCIAIPRWRG
jgi:hypothetical protein